MQRSKRNQWQGTIKTINHGSIVSEVTWKYHLKLMRQQLFLKALLKTSDLKWAAKPTL